MSQANGKGNLADVVLAVERIEKDAKNEFAKYDYASKDAVYGALRGPLAAQGLVPWLSGVEVEYRDVGDKLWMSVTFEAAVTPNGQPPEAAERITVPIQVTGPQSAQALRSYALKYYLATKFMVPIEDEERIDAQPHQRQSMPVQRGRWNTGPGYMLVRDGRWSDERTELQDAFIALREAVRAELRADGGGIEAAAAILRANVAITERMPDGGKALEALLPSAQSATVPQPQEV